MDLFSVLVAFCIFSAFVTCALGFYILAKNPSSTTNRLFFLVMVFASYWAFGEFCIWHTAGYEWTLFWLKVSSFWPVVSATTFHFILVFTDSPLLKKKWATALLILIYAPAILFALTEITTSLIYTVEFLPGTGYVYQAVTASPVYMAETVYILILMAMALYASIIAWKTAERGKIRRQYRLVSAGLGIVILCGIPSGVLLPLYRLYLPNMVFIGIVLFSLMITYTIIRYELFTLSPGAAAPEIIRTLPDGLILGTMDGHIVMANARAAAMCNAREEDLPGRTISECISDPVASTIIPLLLEKGTLADFEVSHGGENGRVNSISGSLVHDPGGDPAGFILIIRDITRRKESETALRLANEKLSLMTQLTRHDIANLITALWGYLDLMKLSPTGADMDIYLDQCLELVKKINHHLQFTREFQDIGHYRPDWQPLDELWAKARHDLPDGTVIIKLAVDPVEIYTDPLCSRVFYNLLENSVRHGRDITKIDISTEETDNGDLRIVISDNGTGIPNENKEKIFGHGYGKHTGIGLALSRKILSITGITIRENGIPGEGARFEISVPGQAWRRRDRSCVPVV
jgi:PAS domain S-box-containing protein